MALPSLGKSNHAIMSVLIGFHKKKQKKMFLFVTILLINDTFDVRVILWKNFFNLGASFLN